MFSCFNNSNTDSTDNTDATCVYIDIYLRQGVSWSPTDSTDSHSFFYTNIMISYHLLVITWLGALWSPIDGADSHRCCFLICYFFNLRFFNEGTIFTLQL